MFYSNYKSIYGKNSVFVTVTFSSFLLLFQALITDYNDLGGGRFYDPRSQQSFKYDHLRKEAIEFKLWEPDRATEVWRRALEEACTSYTQDHYRHGTCCVFSSSQDRNITLTACIEDHQFQPKNFW